MYNVGDIFYEDSQYAARAQFCNENNLRIIEIDPDQEGKARFKIISNEPQTQFEINVNEYYALKTWFNSVYSYKEQKFRRLTALNKNDDDGVNPQTKLTMLYEEAETKRARIQVLEDILQTNNE